MNAYINQDNELVLGEHRFNIKLLREVADIEFPAHAAPLNSIPYIGDLVQKSEQNVLAILNNRRALYAVKEILYCMELGLGITVVGWPSETDSLRPQLIEAATVINKGYFDIDMRGMQVDDIAVALETHEDQKAAAQIERDARFAREQKAVARQLAARWAEVTPARREAADRLNAKWCEAAIAEGVPVTKSGGLHIETKRAIKSAVVTAFQRVL